MTTILVATVKGGSGKTTISVNLASALAAAGERVALVDVDRQRSALDWLKQRPADLPAIAAVDWTKDVGELPGGFHFTVVDAPAALGRKDVEELVRTADKIVVPVVPSAYDTMATERFLRRLAEIRSVARGKRAVGVVGNRVRTGTRSADRLEAFLADASQAVVARLRDSQVYVDVAETGIGLFDRRDRARVQPLLDDWEPLLAFVRSSSTAGD